MIHYLRIPKNKFWGWVYSSVAIGLVVGAVGAYAVSRTFANRQIDDLNSQVSQLKTQTSKAASVTSSLQAQLSSTEASLTALDSKYQTLKAQSSKKSSSSSSSTETATLEVLSRTVDPSEVATGDDITLSAKVQGHPDRVTMRIYSSALGYDETFALKRASHTSTTETWRMTVTAPKKRGTYRYYATAVLGDTSATKPGASPGSLTVD